MGRKKLIIDWASFDKLAAINCTRDEISAFLGVSNDTLERACKREKKMSFAAYYDKKNADGRTSLRRKQFDLAQNGNVTMLVWLGKQRLDQTDKVVATNNTTVNAQVNVVDKETIRKANEELEREC